MKRRTFNIKSIIALLMAVMMVLSVTACGSADSKVKEGVSSNTGSASGTKGSNKTTTETTTETKKKDDKQNNNFDKYKKYATDYELDLKESKKDVLGKWDLWKRDEEGATIIQISQNDSVKVTELDELSFFVFDSEELARKKFKKFKENSRKCDRGEYWEEGDDWFISKEPDVYDAKVVWMCCVECNVLIMADIARGNGSSVDEQFAANKDRYRDYIINNAADIQDYVDNEILQNQSHKSGDAEDVVEINSENFPDDKFREFVNKRDNENDGNGILSTDEIESTTWLELEGCKNLKGIDYFTGATSIKLTSCDDISALEAIENLQSIELVDCQNVNVDLSKYTKLENLEIHNCTLTKDIDFKGFEELRDIKIDNSTIGKINVSDCPELQIGDCYLSNVEEVSIDNCPKMKYFEFSKIPNMKKFSINNCPFTYEIFLCVCPELKDIEIKNCAAVKRISILDDTISEIDVKDCPIICEALKDKEHLEVLEDKGGKEDTYLQHENGAQIRYTGDVKFITE